MPIPQMAVLFEHATWDGDPAAVLEMVNRNRAKKGLSPIKSRREG